MIVTMLAAPGSASAAVGPAVANCNGHVLLSASYVRASDGTRFGAIQLCRDGDHYFAIYINYWYDPGEPLPPPQGPMPDGQFANAWLYRYLDGDFVDRFSCDDPGGNDHVLPGQTWCVTPKIYAPSSRVTFRGAGFGYWWDGTKWVHVASGWTQRCNRHVGCVPA
jgi:hypothetical protein